MSNILCTRLRSCLKFRTTTCRLMSGLKSELDSDTKRIQKWKRFFALSLFGVTLTTALMVKKYKRREWLELMQKTRRLQGQKFGDLELFEMKNLVIAEPIVKTWNSIEKFKFRSEDILITAFPKSGITWLQEIVWLIANDLDFRAAKSRSISDRFPYLEFPTPGIKTIDRLEGQRFIKTHLTPSLLFSNKLDSSEEISSECVPKIITIFRNPKDLIVSYYHFSRMNKMIGYREDFDNFFERFIKGSIPYGPVWQHYLDAIAWNSDQTDGKQILIIFFEDLKNDFANQINKICEFIGKPKLNDEDMKSLEFHCSFDQMKYNPAVNYKHWDDLGFRDKNESEFMRRGQIGDWVHYLTEEQNKTIDELISNKLGNKVKFVYH